MPEKIIDFHIHSRYSRACSASLDLPHIAVACEQKGIDVVVTGDFTHPAWFAHIKENLTEERQGIYKLSNDSSRTRFILGTEVSCIYSDKDATRRVHLLILAPNIKAVENINTALEARGVNIRSDGRPIMGLSAKGGIANWFLDIDPKCMVVPAHAWTPWFAIFGSKSGYDSIEECFEELSPHIRAIETGLSSDPTMNHRLSKLDDITLISNSDAHSLDKLGREANVMQLSDLYTYDEIIGVISGKDKERFLYTIEFLSRRRKVSFRWSCAVQSIIISARNKSE
jgi:PHP family Zn ribbon phosphoesterase